MSPTNDERPAPKLRTTAVIAGVLLAVVVGIGLLLVTAPLGPAANVIAPIIGCACGGFLAGRLATTAGMYHGVFVGAGWIVLELVGIVPTVTATGLGQLGESFAIIALDLFVIASATVGGFAATRS